MEEEFSNINTGYPQDSNPGGVAWSVADQDDADQGASWLQNLVSGNRVNVTPVGGARQVTTAYPSIPSLGQSTGSFLDKLMNYSLARDQLGLQRQLVTSGRAVGYLGPYGQTTLTNPNGQLIQMALIGGLIYLVVKAVSAA